MWVLKIYNLFLHVYSNKIVKMDTHKALDIWVWGTGYFVMYALIHFKHNYTESYNVHNNLAHRDHSPHFKVRLPIQNV